MPTLPYGKSRSLTPGEIRLAMSVFGTSIQYMRVKIHHGKYMFIQPEDTVMAPNGEIYFPTNSYKDDFSNAELEAGQKALFLHEMTHVWQYQLGYPVKVAGIFESALKHGYNYTLKPNTTLSDYPMETQANIISDYGICLEYGCATFSSRTKYKNSPYKLSELQVVLIDFINNPNNKENLPKLDNKKCEAEPHSADCLTR